MSEYGKIHPPRTIFCRNAVGEMKDEEGNKYECTTNVACLHPIIHSLQTNKWFSLTWTDIVKLAIEAGIDKKTVKAKAKAKKEG